MMHFEGAESFTQPRNTLIAYLGDAGKVAQALKEGEITHAEHDRAAWNVRPKFAFMAGTLHTRAEVNLRSDNELRYLISSTGVGCTSIMDVRLKFSSRDEECDVQWTGDLIELTGILKLVPRGMLQIAALKVITDIWLAVRSDLANAS